MASPTTENSTVSSTVCACKQGNFPHHWPFVCGIHQLQVEEIFSCRDLFVYNGECAGPWCRHQMKAFSALLALCEGNPPVTGGFPSQRPVTRSLMFSLISTWTNGSANSRDAGDVRLHRTYYDVTLLHGLTGIVGKKTVEQPLVNPRDND